MMKSETATGGDVECACGAYFATTAGIKRPSEEEKADMLDRIATCPTCAKDRAAGRTL